jgi:hypothetical protein
MLTGSCLCGNVAYEVTAEPGPIVHCHCVTCRKAHGSAFTTVTNVPRDRFRWTRGEGLLRGYESSPGKTRYFCTQCGSQIVAEREGKGHPAADGLPRHRDNRSAEGAYLAIGVRLVVRSERPVAGVARGCGTNDVASLERECVCVALPRRHCERSEAIHRIE